MTKAEFETALLAALPGYLRIDTAQTEAALLIAIAGAAAAWVEDGVGASAPWEDARVMMLGLCAGADLYDQRGYVVRGNTNAAVRESTRRLMDDFMLQLRLGGDA